MAQISQKKTEQPEAPVTFDLPNGPFFFVSHFNRFGLKSLGHLYLLHFGLVDDQEELAICHSCFVEKALIEMGRDSWLTYLGQLGVVPSKPFNFDWKPPKSNRENIITVSSNLLQIARMGELAEFRFYSYSLGFAADKLKGTTAKERQIIPQPTGLFFSEVELHVAIIMALLGVDEIKI